MKTESNHISMDESGRAVVTGTTFAVEDIAREMLANCWTPEQFCRQHRKQISLAQIHAALSYHYDHLDNSLMLRDRVLHVINEHKKQLRKLGVKRMGIFGSCVRNEADQSSDLDVLVDLKKKNLSSYMGVKRLLEKAFDRKVDLVMTESLKQDLREPILKEVVYAEGF